MGRPAVLAIKILADARQARTEVDATGRSVDGLAKRADKFKAPAAAVVGGLALLGKSALDAASHLQQSTGAVQQVYGKYAADVQAKSKAAATSVGLSTAAYQDLAVLLGSQLKNAGTPMDQLGVSTDALVKKGADLAAMFGGTTKDAVEAISSLLKGERDPIEKYGVSISQATIDAYEAAHGLKNLTGAAKKTADAQATLAILNKQTADATGQFGRETSSAAGAQEIANAKYENAKAKLGTVLLPIYAKFMATLGQVAGFLSRHSTAVQVVVGVLGALAVAVLATSAATKVATAVTKLWTAGQWLLNAALSANPITLVVLALAALVGGLVLAYQRSETFRAIVQAAFGAVLAAGAAVGRFFTQTLPGAFNAVVSFLRRWVPLILAILVPFIGIPLLVARNFDRIKDFVGNAFNAARDRAAAGINAIVGFVGGLPGRLARAAGSMASAGGDLIGAFFRGITRAVSNAGSFVGDMVSSITHALGRGINSFLNLPWRIRVHIPIPAAPDVNFGPYTVLPAINAAAAVPAAVPIDQLAPGFTLMAAMGTTTTIPWPAQLSGRLGGTTVLRDTVNVTFTGLVTDPEGVARQITDVLDRRAARIGAGR